MSFSLNPLRLELCLIMWQIPHQTPETPDCCETLRARLQRDGLYNARLAWLFMWYRIPCIGPTTGGTSCRGGFVMPCCYLSDVSTSTDTQAIHYTVCNKKRRLVIHFKVPGIRLFSSVRTTHHHDSTRLLSCAAICPTFLPQLVRRLSYPTRSPCPTALLHGQRREGLALTWRASTPETRRWPSHWLGDPEDHTGSRRCRILFVGYSINNNNTSSRKPGFVSFLVAARL